MAIAQDGAVALIYWVIINTEIARGFVVNIGDVREHYYFIELQSALKQMFDLPVVDRRRIGTKSSIEIFDLRGMGLSHLVQ